MVIPEEETGSPSDETMLNPAPTSQNGLGRPNSYAEPGTPTWEQARTEIDAYRPLKVGFNGHSNAGAGYYLTTDGTKYLWLYNPGVGYSTEWRDFSTIIPNYVYVK